MITTHIRNGVNARLAEAREFLTMARAAEQDRQPGAEAPAIIGQLKGMMYIPLYAAIEYCVTQATQTYIADICTRNVRPSHLQYVINAIALDTELTSAREAGVKRQWPSRRAVFSRMAANDACEIQDTVFGPFLHNMWPRTIEEIFACLAIDAPIVNDPREINYLREIVDKRNAIAHGRDTAHDAAEGMTLDDMQLRIDTVYSVSMHVLDTLTEHATGKKYIKGRYRRMYA